MCKKRILITGGCGFVGSHISLILLENNFDITIIDSNINSSSKVIDNITRISNNKNEYSKDNICFVKGDLRNINFIDDLFNNSSKEGKIFDCVIHLSGLKSVSESIHMPIQYWESNVSCTINLLKVMEPKSRKKNIFLQLLQVKKLEHLHYLKPMERQSLQILRLIFYQEKLMVTNPL